MAVITKKHRQAKGLKDYQKKKIRVFADEKKDVTHRWLRFQV